MGQVPESVTPLSFFLIPLQALESLATAKFAFMPLIPMCKLAYKQACTHTHAHTHRA